MKPSGLTLVMCAAVWLAAAMDRVRAQGTNGTNVFPIDLPVALRLAGAQNLEVQIARERLAAARAEQAAATEQFFPWIAPGIGYHRRDGVAQAVPSGIVSEANYQAYAPGATLAVQTDWGEALFRALETRQLTRATSHALDARSQESLLTAAQGYFDLAGARAAVAVSREALRIALDYANQLDRAVAAGIAFRGDALRARTQAERNRLLLRQAQERQRVTAARLSETLHLDATVELVPLETDPVPAKLVDADASLSTLVQQALAARPELKQTEAIVAAARAAKNGATYGPLVPTLGAQAFFGGLGGGPIGGPGSFEGAQDYMATLGWRFGPGGLFDPARRQAATARLNTAGLVRAQIQDQITRQVVESATRVRSQSDQIATAREALTNAEETLRLTSARQEFGVGLVLENIQAQQDLTRAREDYLQAVTEFDRAQWALCWALGDLGGTPPVNGR